MTDKRAEAEERHEEAVTEALRAASDKDLTFDEWDAQEKAVRQAALAWVIEELDYGLLHTPYQTNLELWCCWNHQRLAELRERLLP